MITRYGYSTVGTISIFVMILVVAGLLIEIPVVRYVLFALAAILLVFTLNFFRDPERISPTDKNVIVTPADGKVLLIKDVEEPSFIKGKAKQISVFMSPLNVHVNRIPVDGTIAFARMIPGKFLVAFDDKASSENERSEIGVNSSLGKVYFTQVSGFVARRIIFELKEGQKVTLGEKFGMIKFGSRVDVLVAPDFEVCVKVGDVVRAGETVLFRKQQ